MTKPVKDMGASARQRLQNAARKTKRPFQEVLEYYAIERFLYRLARSPHAERFVLKGALMFRAWNAPASRPTKDIDLLGRLENTVEAVVPLFQEVCGQSVEPDGMVFHPETVAGVAIKEHGIRDSVVFACKTTLSPFGRSPRAQRFKGFEVANAQL